MLSRHEYLKTFSLATSYKLLFSYLLFTICSLSLTLLAYYLVNFTAFSANLKASASLATAHFFFGLCLWFFSYYSKCL